MPESVDVTTLAYRLEALAGEVKGLGQGLNKHVEECGASNIANGDVLKALLADVKAIKDLPMKAVRYIGGLIITAAVGLAVQSFIQHQQSNQTADLAAGRASVAATQATQAAKNTAAIAQAVGAASAPP